MFSELTETLLQDARFGIRVLRKSPGFTLAAVVTLTLAIGANAVVFGVLNALILRPLDVPRADSLYSIEFAKDKMPVQSYPDYIDLRDRNRSFEMLTACNFGDAGLDTGNNPSRAWFSEVSANYFDALGIKPYLGRFFHGSDEHGPNSVAYIVLTYAYWHSHFLDDRGVVGRTVKLNKYPYTILGVAPRDFHGTILFFLTDFFVPIVNQEQLDGWNGLNERNNHWVFMVSGHLRTGVTPAQAIADLNSVGSYLEKTYPKADAHMKFILARPSLAGDFLGAPARAFLSALMLLAGLILLAACANLGSLFAARATERTREVALRLALGSSRNRILRGLFTEAIMISLVGGALGLAGGVVLLRVMSVWRPVPMFPIVLPVRPDANVYAIAALLAVASGVLFGMVPVRQVLQVDPYGIVKSGSRTIGERRFSAREVLLGLQIAICAVLVTASLVAARGLMRSLHSDFGFEPRNAMVLDTVLNMAGYHGDAVPAMQKRMVDAAESIPGVTAAGLIGPTLPLTSWSTMTIYRDETTDLRPANAAAEPVWYSISPDYFRAAGTPLLNGRALTLHDNEKAPHVAVVNAAFTRKMFGSVTNAIGRRFKLASGTRVEVVGIVENGKYQNLQEDPQPAMFLPILQSPTSAWLVVRSRRGALETAAVIRRTMHDLDPGLPISVQTWEKQLDFALFPSRVATIALGVLGMMGAMLSITGIFGMAAYSVSRRMRELGIRMALGAQRKEVLRAALGRAFRLLACGSMAGLILGMLASRVLASIVYQASSRDPLVLAGVVVTMALLGLIATWIPAQRALSFDPLVLLREE